MLSLFAKAAIYSPKRETSEVPKLPNSIATKTVRINPKHCKDYNALCDWQAGIESVIHPNYVQVLSFPLQLKLMTTSPFPFKAFGLVHIGNRIEVNKLPEQNSCIDLSVTFGNLYWHKRGWVFEVITSAQIAGETRVRSTSLYLSRVKHRLNGTSDTESAIRPYIQHKLPLAPTPLPIDSDDVACHRVFKFNHDTGRQYASVSGDHNPIHLSAFSAKLFGFKRAIAHGMYSKALSVSCLFQQVPHLQNARLGEFSINTEFVQPVYLPSDAVVVANKVIRESEAKATVSQVENQKFYEHYAHKSVIAFRLASTQGDKIVEHLCGQLAIAK